MFFLNSYVIGGCDLVGKLPSHHVWVSNEEREYLGGISWGGEGSNYTARVSWFLSDIPTFMYVYGKEIKLHLEIFEENTCVPDPLLSQIIYLRESKKLVYEKENCIDCYSRRYVYPVSVQPARSRIDLTDA